MNSLESCYELEFSKINFQERKIRITHPKTILIGPPKAGKSYLIYDYLSNFQKERYLYIDFNDYRNDLESIKNFINDFIKEKKIEVLVLENFSNEFEIPKCDSVIITSKIRLKLFGFKELFVNGLDLEEYLLHDNKHQNITASFNYFLKYGNLSEIISYDEHKKISRLQEIIKLSSKNSTDEEILKILFTSVDEKKSINQLFTILKKSIKISKDRFYEMCKVYEENRMIFFLQKYKQEKAVKKLYCYNHAFLNALSHMKKFKNEFSNMIFLHLINEHKEIYYLDKIDFYLPELNLAIVSSPFFNSVLGNNLIKKLQLIIDELNIEQLYIITVSNSEKITYKNCEINILPFYEWALQ